MKKSILAVIIVLVLAVCFSSIAFADEILFRSIPWFSNYENVMDTLDKLDVAWSTPSVISGQNILSTVKEESSNSDKEYLCVCTVYANKSDISLQVAGYDVTGMTLYFAYVPGKDGEIDHSLDDTSFYMARYTISMDGDEYDLTLKDLMNKLDDLYGKPKSIKADDGCDSTIDDIYKWSGSKNTFVYLAGDDNRFGASIRLYYGTEEGDTLIKNAEKIQKQQELNHRKDNGSDGL